MATTPTSAHERSRALTSAHERLLSSAIWLDDGLERPDPRHRVKTGLLFCGFRHPDIYATMFGSLTESTMKDARKHGRIREGFLTSLGRFVDRDEGLEIATRSGQLSKPLIGGVLTSEDLW